MELLKLAGMMGLGSGRDPDRIRAQMAKIALQQEDWMMAVTILDQMLVMVGYNMMLDVDDVAMRSRFFQFVQQPEGDWGVTDVAWNVTWSVLARGQIDPEAHRRLLVRALTSCPPR